MIGMSIYVRGNLASVQALAVLLHVPPANLFASDAKSTDYGFYERQENSLTYTPLNGDFDFLCDADVFHMTAPELLGLLTSGSQGGLVLAVPDEASESPFDCIMFQDGKRHPIELLQDDVLDEVRIHRPKPGEARI
jgi:hypothetical protein